MQAKGLQAVLHKVWLGLRLKDVRGVVWERDSRAQKGVGWLRGRLIF